MILKLAQMVGVPAWAVKLGFVIVAALLLLWAYAAWRDSVIDDYEAGVQANVEVVTNEATAAADAEMKKAEEDFIAEMETDRKDLENAKAENRSPLDALFD